MKRIRNESDLKNWFKKNYKKLGFSKIIRYDEGKFPDFVVQENDKTVRIELETKASNFNFHKHPIDKVDKVICIEKDVDLDVPVLELENFRLVSPLEPTPYSLHYLVNNYVKKEIVVTSSEVARKFKLAWNTAEKCLLELALDNKIKRIKKKGVNVWILKK